MSAQRPPFVPPAPTVHKKDLPLWRLIWNSTRSSLSIWPDRVFDAPYVRNTALGIETILVNDPDGIRHVMTTNAVNYRRPHVISRFARPLGGSGLFLAEGANWRRQRRLLAPTFAPASAGLLLPHFHAAGIHLLRGLEKSPQANLSRTFQDTALEAVLRALFSMPESGEREKLRRLAYDYVGGPGRPNLLDGLAKSENAFAFALRKRERFRESWFAEIERIIAARRAASKAAPQRDLLDVLLSAKDAETTETLSGLEVRDQCGTMLFAGSETTARLMFWAAYLMALIPEEQARLRAEISAFPPERVSAPQDLQN